MPKVSPIITNFGGGEFGPLVYGRVDSDRYRTGVKVLKNYVPTLQGPADRRPGTQFVARVKSPYYKPRLIPFEYSTTQAYMIELGASNFRFYKDNSLILNAAKTITGATRASQVVVTSAAHGFSNGDKVVITGVSGMTELNNREFVVANVATNTFELLDIDGATPVNSSGFNAYVSGGSVAKVYEVAHSYSFSEFFEVKFTQSADVLYLVHPSHPPRKLSRSGHTSWTLTDIDFLDGPYLSTNTTTTTLTPSAATGTGVTLTASAVTGINEGLGFQTTDVGRLIRIKEGSTWGYVKITARVSTTVVTVTVLSTLTNTSAKATWRMGVWSATTGYPSSVVFFEDRLFLGGCTNSPQRIDGSRSGDYENFAPSDNDGTIASSHAVGYTLNANDVNNIRWMTSDEKGLLVGTVGGEWTVKPSSQSEALSPTNISAKKATSYGSANVQPVQSGKSTIFVQRSGKKLRDMSYFYDVDGFRASDLNVLSHHITGDGVTQLAIMKEPQTIVWAVREDGVLLAMTYERDIESFKVGWARQILGGTSDSKGTHALVESVAVIPSADGLRDEVWLVVKRYIDGVERWNIEYITKFFEETDAQTDAYFLDGGATYDDPRLVVGFSISVGGTVTLTTFASHGYSNGDKVRVSGITGGTGWLDEVEGQSFTIANVTSNSFELSGFTASGFSTLPEGTVYVRKLVTVVEGLNFLEGETVSILADGAVVEDLEVVNGRITLPYAAATIHAGYSYNSDGQLLRLDAGAADGTAIGKTRRTHRIGMMLHQTGSLQYGRDFDSLYEVDFRVSEDLLSQAVPLFSGIKTFEIDSDYDLENEFCWRQSKPLPGKILAIMPQMVTQDRG